MLQTKICSKCKKEKQLSKFGPDKGRNGLRRLCKQCEAKYAREKYRNNPKHRNYVKESVAKYRKRNPEKIKQLKKIWYIKSTFGISLKNYENLKEQKLELQQGCCAICGKHISQIKDGLGLDHNHKTGQIRGLLCLVCNTRLAHLEDLEFVIKAKIYLNGYASI